MRFTPGQIVFMPKHRATSWHLASTIFVPGQPEVLVDKYTFLHNAECMILEYQSNMIVRCMHLLQNFFFECSEKLFEPIEILQQPVSAYCRSIKVGQKIRIQLLNPDQVFNTTWPKTAARFVESHYLDATVRKCYGTFAGSDFLWFSVTPQWTTREHNMEKSKHLMLSHLDVVEP